MSTIFKLLVFVVLVLVPILAASIPNMAKTPNAKSLRLKSPRPKNKERYDSSVNDYMSEVWRIFASVSSPEFITKFWVLQRICGFNEMCKEEFSTKFRCRCPYWSFCSSPGRYYNAYCVMSGAGYLWTQPQGFFNGQVPKSTRYKKKWHKTKGEKSLPHSLALSSGDSD